MSPFTAKLKIIFLPFLIVAIGTIAGYSFLNWLLIIHLHLWLIDEDVINIFIPIALPLLPLVIWVLPKLNLLRLNRSGRRNPGAVLVMMLWIILIIPMLIAQQYLLTATGKLTRLEAMSQIATKPATKYYTAKHFYPDKNWTRVASIYMVSGKHHNYYDMYLYFAVPVFDSLIRPNTIKHYKIAQAAGRPLLVINGIIRPDSELSNINAKDIVNIKVIKDKDAAISMYGDQGKNGAILITTRNTDNNVKPSDPPPAMEWPVAWIGFKYTKTISNNRSLAEKKLAYHQFFRESLANFDTINLTRIKYLDRVGYNKDQFRYLSAVNNTRYAPLNHQAVILAPVFDSFENRNGDKLAWILISFCVGAGLFLIILGVIKPDWNYPGRINEPEY